MGTNISNIIRFMAPLSYNNFIPTTR